MRLCRNCPQLAKLGERGHGVADPRSPSRAPRMGVAVYRILSCGCELVRWAQESGSSSRYASEEHLQGSIVDWICGDFGALGTLLLLSQNKPEEALGELEKSYRLLPSLDAKDRAEVLCSIRLVGSRIPIWITNIEDQTRAALAALPVQCSVELDRLGLLTT